MSLGPCQSQVQSQAPGGDAVMTGEAPQQDEAALEFGRWLFAQDCRFVTAAVTLAQLPPMALPEVAFAGRSNVGKSSLLNALTGRKTLARTSHTPGRTQQLNFFELGGRLTLVDLPGYGYARASKQSVRRWTNLTRDFLKGRASLRRVCLLIDARHCLQAGRGHARAGRARRRAGAPARRPSGDRGDQRRDRRRHRRAACRDRGLGDHRPY